MWLLNWLDYEVSQGSRQGYSRNRHAPPAVDVLRRKAANPVAEAVLAFMSAD
jgi:hypothetical protein